MKILRIIPLASLLMASCSNTEDSIVTVEHEVDNSTIKLVTVSATDYRFEGEDQDTRGVTYNGSSAAFAWTERDTLGIFPDKGDQISFSLSDGIGTDYAVIDGGGWALKRTSKYTAYSPFNRQNYYCDREHIVLDYTGQVETGIGSADHLGAYDFQATDETGAVDDKLSFRLKRLNCLWVLRLTIPQAGTYKRIKVSAASPIFTVKANLALGARYTYTPVEMAKTVVLGLEEVTTTQENQVADFLMMLGPVDMTGQEITVSLLGANGYEYKATRILSSNFTAGASKRSAFTLVIDDSANVGIGGEFEEKEENM